MDERTRRPAHSTYGSLAYDLDTFGTGPRFDDTQEASLRRRHEPRAHPQRHAHAPRFSPLLIGSMLTLGIMVMVLMLGLVRLTTVSGHISTLKSEITRLTEENVNLTTDYERTFDLTTIKAVAEENGMSKPSSGQIEYIDLGGNDMAVVYAQADPISGKLAGALPAALEKLWEYFR